MSAAQTGIEARLRVLVIIWAAMLASVGMYAGLGYFIKGAGRPVRDSGDTTPLLAFAFAGLVLVNLSFILRARFLSRAAAGQSLAAVQSGYIISFALCDGAALLGFVALMTTSLTYSYLLLALGAAGIVLNLPRRKHLLAATVRGPGAGRQRGEFY